MTTVEGILKIALIIALFVFIPRWLWKRNAGDKDEPCSFVSF